MLLATAISLSLVSLAPSVNQHIHSLLGSSRHMEAYLGDGILIGDPETNVPFSTVKWSITQVPAYGNSRHTVSIFKVPEHVARRHIYRYKSHHTTEDCYPADEKSFSIGMRSYIYLLPKRYLKNSKYDGSEGYINYELLPCYYDDQTYPKTQMVYQFENRSSFSDYVDGEKGSTGKAIGCSCLLDNAFILQHCPDMDPTCVKKLKEEFGCQGDGCYGNLGPFTSHRSSYNFFSTYTPKGSLVKYDISVEMFFYNHTLLGDYYVCTVRGTDTCTLQTPGYVKHWPFKQERYLIIAYAHPTSVPGFYSTRLRIDTQMDVNYVSTIAFLCACVVFFVVKHCLKMCSVKPCT